MFDSDRLKDFVARQGIEWPDLLKAIDLSIGKTPTTIWDYPRVACQAVGGDAGEIAEMACTGNILLHP